ncbi:Tumor necrosis factor receptor superfamily member 13B, partial [Opisthocomus hoazin]
ESMDCNTRAGFYYDELLKKCINCTTVCGQHPKQCVLSCESKAAREGSQRRDRHSRPPPRRAASSPHGGGAGGDALFSPRSASPTLGLRRDLCRRWKAGYLLRCLCLCALVCSLLLGWTHLRRKGEVVSCQASAGTCHRREDSSKANTRSLFADRLVEAGSVGDGSAGGRVPEPVETCGFCFPGHGSAVQETKSCHGTSYHIGERAAPSHSGICSTGSAGAISSPEDGHFKIICSPAQEKMPMV